MSNYDDDAGFDKDYFSSDPMDSLDDNGIEPDSFEDSFDDLGDDPQDSDSGYGEFQDDDGFVETQDESGSGFDDPFDDPQSPSSNSGNQNANDFDEFDDPFDDLPSPNSNGGNQNANDFDEFNDPIEDNEDDTKDNEDDNEISEPKKGSSIFGLLGGGNKKEQKRPKEQKPPKTKKEKSQSSIRGSGASLAVAVVAGVLSVLSLGVSLSSGGVSYEDLDITNGRMAQALSLLQEVDSASMKNTVSIENINKSRDKNSEYLESVNSEVNKLKRRITEINGHLDVLVKGYKKVLQDTNTINKMVRELPSSTVGLVDKVENLERLFSSMDNSQISEELSDIKGDIMSQRKLINDLSVRVMSLGNSESNTSYEKQMVELKKLIFENQTAIKSATQKLDGIGGVSDVFRVQTLSKGQNKPQPTKIGYKILGSIATESFYIQDNMGNIIEYKIGDQLEGYGRVTAISSDGVISTETGDVRVVN